MTFGWTAGLGASAYWLDLGSAPGGNNYFQSGNLVGSQWYYNQYTYISGP